MTRTPLLRGLARLAPRASLARLAPLAALVAVAGCGGGSTPLVGNPNVGVKSKTPQAAQKLGFPAVATKNTTRVGGGDPIADAAGVALAVYPSQGAGTHPQVVTIAPTDNWQAALASASLEAPPMRAPILLSNSSSLSSASADALSTLAPTGSGATGGSQIIRVGDVAAPSGLRSSSIAGHDPFVLAAAIDRFATAARGKATTDVMVVSADDPTYAMPAAGWAAESGDPILFVTGSDVPPATRDALLAHQHPRIYVVGPASVIPDSVLGKLRKYGPVKRVSGSDAVSNATTFAAYRDPPCPVRQGCAHIPGSFGWAMRSPGHGYLLVNLHRPLDAAAAAALSGSGQYGPILLVDDAGTLPRPVLEYFLNYAAETYPTSIGPTGAVYNHAWVIGDTGAISVGVQAQVDNLLEIVPPASK
jgi:hypothetical protein